MPSHIHALPVLMLTTVAVAMLRVLLLHLPCGLLLLLLFEFVRALVDFVQSAVRFSVKSFLKVQ